MHLAGSYGLSVPLALTAHHVVLLLMLSVTAADLDLEKELLMSQPPRRPSAPCLVLMDRRGPVHFAVRPQLLTRRSPLPVGRDIPRFPMPRRFGRRPRLERARRQHELSHTPWCDSVAGSAGTEL